MTSARHLQSVPAAPTPAPARHPAATGRLARLQAQLHHQLEHHPIPWEHHPVRASFRLEFRAP